MALRPERLYVNVMLETLVAEGAHIRGVPHHPYIYYLHADTVIDGTLVARGCYVDTPDDTPDATGDDHSELHGPFNLAGAIKYRDSLPLTLWVDAALRFLRPFDTFKNMNQATMDALAQRDAFITFAPATPGIRILCRWHMVKQRRWIPWGNVCAIQCNLQDTTAQDFAYVRGDKTALNNAEDVFMFVHNKLQFIVFHAEPRREL
jgi:hypothetical protein